MTKCILIVGLGSIGRRHAKVVRSLLPGVQIVALRHQSCQDAQSMGVDHCVTNVADALKFQPQAAVIANPSTHHLDVALALARAGLHLLIEKPISNSTPGVQELIDICEAQKVTLMTGYNMRFLPALQRFRELLIEKRCGRVFSVRSEVGQYLPSWRPGADYRQSVSAKTALGGGVLLELSHEIDYLRWIFGDVDWVNASLLKQSDLEIDVEDTAHLIMGFAKNDGGFPLVASLSLDFIRRDTTRFCTAIGETGSLRWDALAGTIDIFEQGSDAWMPLFVHRGERDDTYLAEWADFLKCVADGAHPMVSGVDGLAVLQIIEAARRSSARGARVSVEKPETAACLIK